MQHTPIPNLFATDPRVEIAVKLDDGRRINRWLSLTEFHEWRKDGADIEDLIDEDEDA